MFRRCRFVSTARFRSASDNPRIIEKIQEHRHSGIGMLTPAVVHFGEASAVLAHRQVVLDAAYLAHPDRFVRQPPKPLPLPSEVWINKPAPAGQKTKEDSQ